MTAPAAGADSSQAGDIGQAVAAVLIFLLLLAALGKWAWKPIIAQLRMREEEVARKVERAEKRQVESEELLRQYEARLDRAEADAQRVLDSSRKEASREKAELLTGARAEAERRQDQAKEAIERARRQALRDLRGETAEIAGEIAAQVIGRNLDAKVHRQIVRDSLEEIRARMGEADR